MTKLLDTEKILQTAREVLRLEADAVRDLADDVGGPFADCCRLLVGCAGRIIVIGMGKSGHIAQKIAATLASTGSPAFFVHPAEASHGDLGMITAEDVVLALSYSGETGELLSLLPLLRQRSIPIIAMTGQANSKLADIADLHLDIKVEREACPLNLAPTASTTAALAMGDALAVALMHLRGFKAEDFAVNHPGGSLGRKLLTKVSDVMRCGTQIPKVPSGTSLRNALPEISGKGLGMTCVLDDNGQLIGVFTDGDLRRSLADNTDLDTPIETVMTCDFQSATADELAAEVLHRMRDAHFHAIPVLEDGTLVGALDMHDLLALGLR